MTEFTTPQRVPEILDDLERKIVRLDELENDDTAVTASPSDALPVTPSTVEPPD